MEGRPSLENLLASVPSDRLDMKISNDVHLKEIANHLTDWRSVRPYFSLFEKDEEDILNGTVNLQSMAVLQKWREKHGPQATYRNLAKAFYEAGRVDMVEVVCKECSPTHNRSEQLRQEAPHLEKVRKETIRLQDRFAGLIRKVLDKLKEIPVDVKSFKVFLLGLSATTNIHVALFQAKDIYELETLDDIFIYLCDRFPPPSNFLNYHLIQRIVNEYKTDSEELDELMMNYVENASHYMNVTNCCDYLCVMPMNVAISASDVRMEVVLNKSCNNCTLAEAENILQNLDIGISNPAFRFLGISLRSVHFWWSVPSAITPHLKRVAMEKTQLFTKLGIIRLAINGSNVFTAVVQGLLDGVLNLAIVRADDYNHILTWDPPFTLDITDVHPDIITYTVCNNITRSCQNISETLYVFPTLCDPVEFTVSAWNPVGEGERTSIVHEPPDDVRRSTSITSLESEVSFKSLSEPVITLSLQVDGNCFNLLNIEFSGQYSGVREFENLMPTVDGTGTATLTFSENLMADDFYTVTVMEQETIIFKEMNMTTFDVQKEDVKNGGGGISVTCVFASGSQAQGCLIVVSSVIEEPPYSNASRKEAMRGELANGELEGNASTSFTDLEAGTYNVLIYDVGVDGTFDLEKSLYNQQFEIKNISLSIGPTSASPAPNSSIPPPSSVDDAIPIPIVVVVVLVVVVVVLVFIVYKKQVSKENLEKIRQAGQQPATVELTNYKSGCNAPTDGNNESSLQGDETPPPPTAPRHEIPSPPAAQRGETPPPPTAQRGEIPPPPTAQRGETTPPPTAQRGETTPPPIPVTNESHPPLTLRSEMSHDSLQEESGKDTIADYRGTAYANGDPRSTRVHNFPGHIFHGSYSHCEDSNKMEDDDDDDDDDDNDYCNTFPGLFEPSVQQTANGNGDSRLYYGVHSYVSNLHAVAPISLYRDEPKQDEYEDVNTAPCRPFSSPY